MDDSYIRCSADRRKIKANEGANVAMVFGNIRCCATITRMIHLNMKVFRYKTKDTDSIDNIREQIG